MRIINELLFPWLNASWLHLQTLQKQNRFPHALLIAGSEGLGKSTLAIQLAEQLLCQNATPAGACKTCLSCHLIKAQNHPDYRCLGAEGEAIGIDDIRSIADFLSQTAHQAGPKVIVLLEADKLPVGAANALLKTLEEPSSAVHIILVTNRVHSLLATLRSRCFRLTLPLPSNAMALAWLRQQQPQASHEDLQWCLTLAGAAPLKAQQLWQQMQEEGSHYRIQNVMQLLQADISNDGELQQFITAKPVEALYLFYYGLTGLIRHFLQCSTAFLITGADKEHLQKLTEKVTLAQTLIFLEKVKEALEVFARVNVNKALLLESLFYQWYFIQKSKEIV